MMDKVIDKQSGMDWEFFRNLDSIKIKYHLFQWIINDKDSQKSSSFKYKLIGNGQTIQWPGAR